jgi:soluble lytic murein transglycosylase-like protein
LELDPAYRPVWFVRLVRWLARVTAGLAKNVSARLVDLVKEVLRRAMQAARMLWQRGVELYLKLRVQYQARRTKAAVICLPHLDEAGNRIGPASRAAPVEEGPTTVFSSPQWNHVHSIPPPNARANQATSRADRDARHISHGRGYVFVTRLTIFACGILTAMVAGKLVNGNALQALHSNNPRGMAMSLFASAGPLRDSNLPAISLDAHQDVLQDMMPMTAPQLSLQPADKLAYLAPVALAPLVETDVAASPPTPQMTDPIVVYGDSDLDISSPTSVWSQAGAEYNVDPLLLYSVALVETCTSLPDGSVAPTPWVVRIQGNLVEGSRADVVNAITQARARGLVVQDVGVMQVYYPLHSKMEPDPIALLSPKRNVEVGAQILVAAMHETNDPIMGLGYYHSHDARLAKYYGTAVNTVYHRLQQLMGRMPSQVAEVSKTKASFTVASSQ